MKNKYFFFSCLLTVFAQVCFAQTKPLNGNAANKQLSNLDSATAINSTLLPKQNDSVDVGSGTLAWRNIYFSNSVYFGTDRLFWVDKTNTALGLNALHSLANGEYNTATGFQALYSNTNGIKNTATGYQALYSNLTGKKNMAVGYKALTKNTTGNHNAATGYRALTSNTTGSDNTGNGYRALSSNTTGSGNTAIGYHTQFNNLTGEGNTSVGNRSLNTNKISNGNTAIGNFALIKTTGEGNTAVGNNALLTNSTGTFNTAIGSGADASESNFTNATAIGYGAIVTASNSIMLGNSSVTSVKAAGNIVIVSDERFKKNIKQNVPGLSFINTLSAVTFNYDIKKLNSYTEPETTDDEGNKIITGNKETNEKSIIAKEKILYSGFIAQEVEKAANKIGYNFSGLYKPQNDKDVYGISYADFVVPLVKAVQELSKLNNDKDEKLEAQQKEIDELKLAVKQLQQGFQQCNICGSNFLSQNKSANSIALLEQNVPNPFLNSTTINYSLPQNFVNAQIVFTDKNGNTLKVVNLYETKGKISVDASLFSQGVYQYSLITDGKLADTKQMIIAR